MTNKELLYITAIADEKSISRAAKKLSIAQPSLSQSLQRIEDSLGTPLFNRTPNGLFLTFAGERYYQSAKRILKVYADFEAAISDINDLKTGRVCFGTTNHLGTLVLPEVIPEFKQNYPDIELHILEENSTSLEQDILSSRISFAVMHAPKDTIQTCIQYEVLRRDPFLIALSPNHPLLGKAVREAGIPYPVLDLKYVENESFLMLHKEQRIRQITDSFLEKAGIHHPNILLTLRNYETAQLLAARGVGITFVPTQYSARASSQWKPAFLSIDDAYDAGWDLCIATLRHSFLSKADQKFIESVKKSFH